MTALPLPARPKGVLVAGALLVAGLLAAVLSQTWDVSALAGADALRHSWARLGAFLQAFATPDLSADALATAGALMLETLAVALLGVALGLALGFPIAMGACRALVLGGDPPRGAGGLLRRALLEGCRLALDVLRGVPDFAWALILLTVTGINPLTGVLAIGISVAGILGKVLSEQWDNVDPQRYAALRSTGAGRLAVFAYGVLPLSGRAMLSFVLMRTECAIRNASVIGVIIGSGLGSSLWDAFTDSRYDRFATYLLAMLLLTASADVAANLLRYQLRVDPNHPRGQRGTTVASSTARRLGGALVCLLLLLLCGLLLRADLANLGEELRRLDAGFVRSFARRLLFAPDLAALPAAARQSVLPLAVALLTTAGATAGAILLAFPASVSFQLHAHRFTGERPSPARRAARAALLVASRGVALLCRGVPEVAWLLLFSAFLRQGLLAGVLAITVHSTGVLLRVFAETLDNVPYRRLEQVSGACRPGIYAYGGVPSSWADWKTYAFFQFEVNLRMGIVLGMVSGGGLGDAFKDNLGYDLGRACTFLWAMVGLTVAVDRTSRWLQLRRRRC
jgi:phosphonate transport system permease protein